MISYNQRIKIYQRDEFKCYRCGTQVANGRRRKRKGLQLATLDHFIPKSKGGSDDPSNLLTCCLGCNNSKGSKIIPLPQHCVKNKKHLKVIMNY